MRKSKSNTNFLSITLSKASQQTLPNHTVESVIDSLNTLETTSHRHKLRSPVATSPTTPNKKKKHSILDFLDLHRSITPNTHTHSILSQAVRDNEDQNILIRSINRMEKAKVVKKYIRPLEKSIKVNCTLEFSIYFTGEQLVDQIMEVIVPDELSEKRLIGLEIAQVFLTRNLIKHAMAKNMDVVDSDDELYEFVKQTKSRAPLNLNIKEDYFGSPITPTVTVIPPDDVTLNQILSNDHWRTLFKKYSATEYSEENIEFHEHAKVLRLTKKRMHEALEQGTDTFRPIFDSYKQQRAKIYSLFLAPDSLYALNISDGLRDAIRSDFLKSMEENSFFCVIDDSPNFELVERSVEHCMYDVFKRFRDSGMWHDYVTSLTDVRRK